MASRSEIQKAYIERKKQAMGEEAYNAMMREKKAIYRARLGEFPKMPKLKNEQKEPEKEEVVEERRKMIHNNLDALDELRKTFSKLSTKGELPLRPATIDNYTQKINRLNILMTGKAYDGIENIEWAKKPDELVDTLEKSDLKSKKDYITPIIRLLQHLQVPNFDKIKEAYQKKMKSFKEHEYSGRKDNLSSENEKANFIPLKEIQRKIDEYKPKDDMEIIYKLIVSLYFMGDDGTVVPRNNLPDMKFVSSKKKINEMNPEFNYFVIDKEGNPIGVIMNRYKTQSTYGRQKFTFSKAQKEILKQYIRAYGKKTGDFVFVDKNNQPFSYSNFNDLLLQSMEKVLGKRINIDLIRKIIITDYYSKGLHSINEDENFHRRFLHSTNVGREYIKTDFNDD